MSNIKNLDKFIAGADAYSLYDNEWVKIIHVDKDKEVCKVKAEKTGSSYNIRMEVLCPNADGVRLKKNPRYSVCYNAAINISSPYYSPNYNEYFEEDDVTHEVLETENHEVLKTENHETIDYFVKYMTRLFEDKFNAKMGRNNFIADYIHSKFGEGERALNDFMNALEDNSIGAMLDDMIENNLIEDSKNRLAILAQNIDKLDYTDLLRIYDALRPKINKN